MELSKTWIKDNLHNPDLVKLSLVREAQQCVVPEGYELDPEKYASRVIEEVRLETEIDSLRKHYQSALHKTEDEMFAIEELFYSLQISVDDFRNEEEYSIVMEYCIKLDEIRVKLCQLSVDILLNR